MFRAGRFYPCCTWNTVSRRNVTSEYDAETQQKSGFVRLDRVTASRPTPNGIEIRSGTAVIEITALRDDVLRVRVGAEGQLPEDASWAVLPSARTARSRSRLKATPKPLASRPPSSASASKKTPLEITVTDLADM